jgi:tetratricopeptide (TPR) repeat protein
LTHLRTRSILACIDYAHSRLDGDMQRLLLTLFPFTGVIWEAQSENYLKQLQAQPALVGLPFARWPAVLQAAKEWGLLTPHEELAGFLRIQPVLPYFLKTRLAQEPVEVKGAIETAFRLHYADLAEALFNLFESKEPQPRQTARVLTAVEYENLTTALQFSLMAHVSFVHLYAVVGLYLDSVQDHRRGIDLGKSILAQMEQYPPEIRFGVAGNSFLRMLGELGEQQTTLQRYADAEASYEAAVQLIDQSTTAGAQTKATWKAVTYHQLGRVAQEQRQWAQAEQHYQQALAICIEYNGRHNQASTYHQLGRVAEEQEQWQQGYDYYLKDLTITAEFKDEHELEITRDSLRRLWQAHPDESVLPTLAQALGMTVEAARGWITTAD